MTRGEKLLLAHKTREQLEDYLSRYDLEIRLQSPPRHLEPIATVCALLLDRLSACTGATLETRAFADRIGTLTARAIEIWKRPAAAPVLRLVQ
ncbi:MAG TPA: hypothetical protein VFS67_30730 [Polyangiaceae bacterium]|nr:hypothetical protein [Polyangiaceae bacterium]